LKLDEINAYRNVHNLTIIPGEMVGSSFSTNLFYKRILN